MGGSTRVMRVAIVGAGGGGLCALRHFMVPPKNRPESVRYEATCFEQTSRVGGTWAYTDQVGKDEFGNPIHSSMYKNLKTNLPKECMAYPDYPFPSDLPSFNKHEDVQKYIEDYADNFGLMKYIKFQRRVQNVKPVLQSGAPFGIQWEVTTKCARDPEDNGETNVYDAIIIGNGNYAIPYLPDIPGIEAFQGQLIHSHDYRKPENFKGKTVVLLGANSSGQDIAIELSAHAEKVYLSHDKPSLKSPFPDNLEQCPGISKLDGTSQVTFKDGSIIQADTVLLCTGYHYDYSFLSPECCIQVNDFRITPLYKHLINTKYPSMAILGICKRIVPFPFFDMQVRFIKAVLEGHHVLPSEAAMNEDTQRDYEKRLKAGGHHRHSHNLDGTTFRYTDELADLAGLPRIPDVFEEAYVWATNHRRTNVMYYKNMNFIKDSEDDRSQL